MSSQLKAFRSTSLLLDQGIVDGAIVVDANGRIVEVLTTPQECANLKDRAQVIQITDGVLMPGVVDSHVHVNSPGRSEWEDYPHATKAAAAGGITTIVDMPLNSIPPTTTLENLKTKIKKAKNNVYVDVGFWGGVIPGNQNELLDMINAGVIGFKCFLCPSGVDEFPHVVEYDLDKSLEILENTKAVLAFHAECELDHNDGCDTSANPYKYETYLNCRPPAMEVKALDLISGLAEKHPKARYHIVHVSASSAASIVKRMKSKGVNITAETCPHYLTLSAEDVPNNGTEFKCAPPIRSSKNRDDLWEYIKESTIDMVVSDHSPCTPNLKEGGFLEAWGGVSSVQFGLSLIWTNAAKYGLDLGDVSKLVSAAPAELCGFSDKKGSFRVGADADMIVFDQNGEFVVTKDLILYKNKLSPYLGMKLKGRVVQTYLRGNLIFDAAIREPPSGALLLKNI